MRPLARRPRLHVLEVVREVHLVQLVVHELADVPRQVVVTVGIKGERKSLLERSAQCSVQYSTT